MKRFALLMLLCMIPSALIRAQVGGVSIEVVFEQDQYVPGEEIKVGVRITNRSGQPLRLGQSNDWLQLAIDTNDHLPVRQTGPLPIAEPFELGSSQRGTKWVKINPYFDIARQGRYSVVATVQVPAWGQPIRSSPKTLDLMAGVKMKDLPFGVPKEGASVSAEPEVRHYIVHDSDRKGRRTLYLSISDASGSRIFTALPLCELLSFSDPEIQIDSHSNAHLISQTGAKAFAYYEINPEGVILARQTYQFTATRPHLGLNKASELVVVGGERIITKSDLPPPEIFEQATPDASQAK